MKRKARHAPAKGRGEQTMEQLLEAGARSFARYGPEGVTTRQLADAAGVNSAAIAYYFGGKEGYYLAVVRYLIQDCAAPVVALIEGFGDEFERSDQSPEVARAMLLRLFSSFIKGLLLNPYGSYIASIFSREHLHPTAAYDMVCELFFRMHAIVTRLLGRALGLPTEEPDTMLRAHALLGQMFFFRVTATTICRRLGWDGINEERAAHVAEIFSELASRVISPPVAEASAGGGTNEKQGGAS